VCAQNTTQQSICEAGLAELKPGERYFLWSASGCDSVPTHQLHSHGSGSAPRGRPQHVHAL
jgi:hypothetical protein